MKKLRSLTALILAAAMLVGCAGKETESGLEFSDSPFSNGSSETTSEPQADSYEELFGKYQTGGMRFGNYSTEDAEIEYNGGSIDISFDIDTTGNQYDAEAGFMAFINGIPQNLSLNGGESGELVRISQQPDQTASATLSFTPTITEEFSGEETLQLKIIYIFNPSYKPAGVYTGFGNAHLGQPFLERDIKAASPLAVSDSASEPIKGECESVLITDETAKQYGINKPGENSATTVSIQDAQNKNNPLALRGGKLDSELLLYGGETYDYRVYVYVNHERVKFNGGDHLDAAVKSGYLSVLRLELENIQERDIIYAVAIPKNSDTGSMAVRKSGSVLVLDENNIQTDTSDVQTPVDPQPETSEGENATGSKINSIYAYKPKGYIDDDQRYLLLLRHTFYGRDPKYYDFIIYDEVLQKVTGGLYLGEQDCPYGHYTEFAEYGEGVVTIRRQFGDTYDPDSPCYVVYNEKFEVIKEVYDSDISGAYGLTYSPSKKKWYFNKDGCFYTASEDFSETTKTADFSLREYCVLEDKIAYYRTVYNYSDPQNNADIFGIMELDGNIINETKAAPYGSGHFRFGKAGDIIYFMSWQQFDMSYYTEFPMDGMIFYNCKTGEQKMFHPENANENTLCEVTPNGKYLVTGVLDMENHYTINDITLNVYDMDTFKPLESEALGTGDTWFLELSAFNDRAVLVDRGTFTYMFKQQ